jgi:hypothetical protein
LIHHCTYCRDNRAIADFVAVQLLGNRGEEAFTRAPPKLASGR